MTPADLDAIRARWAAVGNAHGWTDGAAAYRAAHATAEDDIAALLAEAERLRDETQMPVRRCTAALHGAGQRPDAVFITKVGPHVVALCADCAGRSHEPPRLLLAEVERLRGLLREVLNVGLMLDEPCTHEPGDGVCDWIERGVTHAEVQRATDLHRRIVEALGKR